LIRIVDRNFRSYYIDQEGFVMPVSEYFSAYTLVANGNIHEPIRIQRNQSIFSRDSTDRVIESQLTDLYSMALFIRNDDLWNSQIEQIYVNSDNEYILTPRVGSQTIIFGDGKYIKGKFKKLKEIYRVMNTIGWNTYSTINLKFRNQVVCTKRGI
jgi:cell division protein FtsQ